jgi:flagellin
MALNINTNIGALGAAAAASQSARSMESAMERLASGLRINTAADDAAGVAIASRLTSEIRGTNMAIRNAMDGQALIDTAEGASIEIENILQRMRELSVQAANDTNSDSDRVSLQSEVDQLLTEINRISETTTWGGKTLLGGTEGSASNFTFQIGAGVGAADQISVSVGPTSADALGIGATGAASGGRTTGHAGISYENGRLVVLGQPEQGDVFSLSLNGSDISVTYSGADQFQNGAAGAAAQIKAAIDTDIAASPTRYSGLKIVDNGDGSLSISQSTAVKIDTFVDAEGDSEAEIDVKNGIITFGGTIAADDEPSININGINVALDARAADDGYGLTAVGTAAAFKAEIEATVGLENVRVIDHGDGSITLSQADVPYIEGAEATLTTDPQLSISYNNTGAIAVDGAFVEDQMISFKLFGHEISFTTSTDDGFEDTLAGVASQMAAAINEAGIPGVTAAKTDAANSVTLAVDVNAGNAVVNSGAEFIVTTIDDVATARVAITGDAADTDDDVQAGDNTAAAFADGDAYTFEVAGHEIKLVVSDADGYTDDAEGVSRQMADLVNALGLEGLTADIDATAITNDAAGITITRALNGTAVAGAGGSTVVTDISSLAADEVGDPTFSGSIDVTSATAAFNAITRIDAALEQLNSQRAELGAVSNRLDSTVANLTNISTNLEAGRSRIQDADFAAESTNLAKSQILQQASMAMLAQANASKQGVLSLLQG